MHLKYYVIMLLLVSLDGVSWISAIDLCSDADDSNLTSYQDPDIQNCGCNHQAVCIRRCCKAGYYFGSNRTCFKGNVNLYKNKTTFGTKGSLVGMLKCKNYLSLDKYIVQDTGSYVPYPPKTRYYGNTYYCMDDFDGLTVCFRETNWFTAYEEILVVWGLVISMPFLLATFLVYAILPDRTVYQDALMFYILTLCISYIFLYTVTFVSPREPIYCALMAYGILFFMMVSVFWMNVICFDIWYTFRYGRGYVGSKKTSERRRLLLYNCYAWGVPLLHVLLVYTMQKVLPTLSEHNPRIGLERCFIADGIANLWYFYGEVVILLIINAVFFLQTAFKIRQVKKETSMLKQNDSKRHAYEKDKQNFILYLKLLFAMGVNWIVQIVSWLVNWQIGQDETDEWYVIDVFNAAYGVFIFFMFVVNKKIWKLLQKRYYYFVGKPHLADTTTSTNTDTSHYSTADTTLSDSTNVSRPEEVGLERVT